MARSDIPFSQRMQYQRISDIKEIRDYSAKTTMFLHCIALNQLHKRGYKRLVRFSLCVKDLLDEFYRDDDIEVGLYKARKRLDSHGIPIPEEFPYVPVPELSIREQEKHAHAVNASYIAHLVALIAANEEWGLDKEDLEMISVRVAELSKRYNTEGDKFIHDEMKRIGFAIIDGHVTAFLGENDEPVSYKKWLEVRS